MAETNNVKSNNYTGVLLPVPGQLEDSVACRLVNSNELPITAIMLNNESKVGSTFEALEAYNSFRGFFVYRPPTPQNAHLCAYVCGCGKSPAYILKFEELLGPPAAMSRDGLRGACPLYRPTSIEDDHAISAPGIIMEFFKRNGSEHPLLKVKTGIIPLEEGPGNSVSRFL